MSFVVDLIASFEMRCFKESALFDGGDRRKDITFKQQGAKQGFW